MKNFYSDHHDCFACVNAHNRIEVNIENTNTNEEINLDMTQEDAKALYSTLQSILFD